MDVDIDPHWNTVMYQLFESVPFDYTIGGRAWSPKGHFEEPRIPKVDQARTSFAKKLGMKLATTYISNPFKFQWIQMILWCPKARGDPQVFPSSHGWDSPLYLPWTITSKSTSLFLVVKSSAPLDVSDFLRWGNSWDLKEGVARLEPGSWLPTTAQQALKCVRLMLFAIMK